MRTLLLSLILLLACACAEGAVVTNKALDLSTSLDGNVAVAQTITESVTSTEQTLTITPAPNRKRVLTLKSTDQPWGISNATGAYGTKYPLAANVEKEIVIQPGTSTITLYWQAGSTTASLYGTVRE